LHEACQGSHAQLEKFLFSFIASSFAQGAVFDMRMSNYGNGYDEDEDEWVDSDDPDYDRKMKEREQRRLGDDL